MKVVAFNGSPKENGNTAFALKTVLKELENEGIETKIIHVGNKLIRGCIGCGQCRQNQNEKCIFTDDIVNESVQEMKNADAIIISSPVYYASIAGTMKSFLDRTFYVAGANNNLLRLKIGASVVAVRRSGGVTTFNQLNNYLNIAELVIPSSNYWNVIHGTVPGDAEKDEEGVQIMRTLGKNLAWVLKQNESEKDKIPKPLREEKIRTNFVR